MEIEASCVNINTFPDEILFTIFTFISKEAFIVCWKVCKHWKQLAEDNNLGKLLYKDLEIQNQHFDWICRLKIEVSKNTKLNIIRTLMDWSPYDVQNLLDIEDKLRRLFIFENTYLIEAIIWDDDKYEEWEETFSAFQDQLRTIKYNSNATHVIKIYYDFNTDKEEITSDDLQDILYFDTIPRSEFERKDKFQWYHLPVQCLSLIEDQNGVADHITLEEVYQFLKLRFRFVCSFQVTMKN